MKEHCLYMIRLTVFKQNYSWVIKERKQRSTKPTVLVFSPPSRSLSGQQYDGYGQ